MTVFQGSQTSGVHVTFYTHTDEIPRALGGGGNRRSVMHFDGTTKNARSEVYAVQTSKGVEGRAGTFSVALKVRDRNEARWLFDDDMVDISYRKHGRLVHKLRGYVDDVNIGEAVGASGATERALIVTGRDHQKPFDETPIWFDLFTDDTFAGAAYIDILDKINGLKGGVDQTVASLAFGIFSELRARDRAVWALPPSLPTPIRAGTSAGAIVNSSAENISSGGGLDFAIPNDTGEPLTFLDYVRYDTSQWLNYPERSSVIAPGFFDPSNAFVWPLARHFADPMLCDLYCDLMVQDGGKLRYPGPEDIELLPEDTIPAVILRDKVFPTFEASDGVVQHYALSPWFKGEGSVNEFVADAQELTGIQGLRSGGQRYNTFFAAPVAFAEAIVAWPNLQRPLFSRVDVNRHGLRRVDVTTHYSAAASDTSSILGMAKSYVRRVRDYMMLNHEFLAGSVTFAHGRPEIRAGHRIRVEGLKGGVRPLPPLQAYINRVTDSWSLVQGLRTTLEVSRGYHGDDASLFREMLDPTRLEYNDDEFNTVLPSAQTVPPSGPGASSRAIIGGLVSPGGGT